tara:strand:- start:5698 stop:6936 length:1239 start_codon:yes stop_codon:yes gene_type:complete
MQINFATALFRIELYFVFFGTFLINQLAKSIGQYQAINLFYELLLILIPFLLIFSAKKVNIIIGMIYAIIILSMSQVAYIGFISGSFLSTIFSAVIPFKYSGLLLLSALVQQEKLILEFRKILNISLSIIFVAVGLQLLGFNAFLEFSQPYQLEDGATKVFRDIDSWDNTAWGLFENQISLAYFGICTLVFFKYFDKNSRYRAIKEIACLIIIISTLSLTALILTGIFYVSRIKTFWIRLIIFASGPFILPLLIPLYFSGFDLAYLIEVARGSRIGIIIDILPSFLTTSNVIELFFGLGPGKLASDFIYSLNTIPVIFEFSADLAPLEDVYWVALLIYFGLFGLLGYLIIVCAGLLFYKKVDADLFYFYFIMLLFIFLGNFTNQVLSISTFAIFFWFSLTLLFGEIKNKKIS